MTLVQPPLPPGNSLLGLGSGNFLSITWDLLSFLCQQLSPATQPRGGLFPERPARWPRGLCFALADGGAPALCFPELPAAQLESTQLPRGWVHRETQQFLAQVRRTPTAAVPGAGLWRREQQAGVW